MQQTIKVLLIEDDSDDYRLIARTLRQLNRDIVIDWAECLAAAREKVGRNGYDVILTDLSLPGSQGLATNAKVKEFAGFLPVVVLTSLDDESLECNIIAAGAQDYCVKGEVSGRSVYRAILHAIQRQRLQNQVNSLVVERDATRLKLERQADLLKQKNNRLRRLYRSTHEFVDNVSHDFRTPLTVIKDYVNIIREGMVGEINEEQQSMLDKVSVRADDLNHMVDDLLDASKLESGLLGLRRRNVATQSVIYHIESMLHQRAQIRNIDLRIECEDNLPDSYCDAQCC